MGIKGIVRGGVFLVLAAGRVAFAQTPTPEASPSPTATPAATPAVSPTASPVPTAQPAATARPIEDLDLDELLNLPVVTASGGKAEERALTAANVISISREQIAARGWRSLAEILESVPGLYVSNDHMVPGVAVRGVSGGLRAGTRIVRVMINSVEVNFRPELTAFTGPEYIPIEVIERVEVAKGPLSALYGANAFLATVNVITRDPQTAEGSAAVRSLMIEDGEGYGGSAMVGYGNADAGFMAAVNAERVDRSGLAIEKTFPEQDPDSNFYRAFFAGESEEDIAAPLSVYAKLRAKAGPLGNLTAQGGLQRLDSNGEFLLNSVLTHRTRVSIENTWASLEWSREFGKLVRANLRGGTAAGQPTREEGLFLTANNDYTFRRNFRYRAVEASGGATVSPLENLDITGGFDWRQDDQTVLFYTRVYNVEEGANQPGDEVDIINPADTRKFLQTAYGAYVQAAGGIKGVRLSATYRVDEPGEGFDNQSSWRASVAYRFTDWLAAKVIAGRAFQVPSGVLLYGLSGFGSANNIVGSRTANAAGLRELKPQTTTSIEAIVTASVLDRVAVEGAVFQQEVEDKIEFLQRANTFVAQNRGTSKNVGTELGLRAPIGRFDPHLTVAALWTRKGGEYTLDPPQLYPGVQAFAGIGIRIPEAKLQTVVDLVYAGERGASQSNILLNNEEEYTLPAYTRIDLAVSTVDLRLVGSATETRILARVRNLTDERWSEPGFGGFDIPQFGRTYHLEVRQSF